MDERRKDERISLPSQPEGDFSLLVDDKRVTVMLIDDVSPFGAKVLIPEPVLKNTELHLVYQRKNLRMEIEGSVKWSLASRPVDQTDERAPVHSIGISFEPRKVEKNTLFFNILTEKEA